MKNFAALLVLLASMNAHAMDRLTPAQLVGESVFVGLMAIDYKQTQRIPGFCNGQPAWCTVHETNPMLGTAPSPERIRNYFAGAALMHVAIMAALPSDKRAAWIASGIALEAIVVGRNKRLGLRIKF